jgi:hypothetical protein
MRELPVAEGVTRHPNDSVRADHGPPFELTMSVERAGPEATPNPRQRGAHEHLGEAYLVQGDLAKAEEHLAALERICLIPCEEHDELKRAIAAYSKVVRR